MGRSSAITGRGAVAKAPLGVRPVELGGANGGAGGAGGAGGGAFRQQRQGRAVAKPDSVALKQSFWDSLAGGGGAGGAKKKPAAGSKGQSFKSPLPKGFPPGPSEACFFFFFFSGWFWGAGSAPRLVRGGGS